MLFFGNHVLPRGGFVLGSETKLAVRADRGRKTDLSIFFPGGAGPPRRGPIKQPPDIAVEVITPTPRDERRDRVEKMDDYRAFAVRYYWLVDPALRSVEVFELRDGLYARVAGATSGNLDVPGRPGLVLDIDGFWAKLAELDAQAG